MIDRKPKVLVDAARRPRLSRGMLSVIGYLALLGLFVYLRVRWIPRPDNEEWADPLLFIYLLGLIAGLIYLSWSTALLVTWGALLSIIFVWILLSEAMALTVRPGPRKWLPDDMPILRPEPIGTSVGNALHRAMIWLSVRRTWRLDREWRFLLLAEDEPGLPVRHASLSELQGKYVVIPETYPVDGASVPRLLWALFSPTGILLIPAIVHDFAYRQRGLLCAESPTGEPTFRELSRTQADTLFRSMFVSVNRMPVLAWIPYVAVSLFGWPAFRAAKKQEVRLEPRTAP